MTIHFRSSDDKGQQGSSKKDEGSIFRSGGQTKKMAARPRISTGRQAPEPRKRSS
ncbi:hypothetical protein [Nocardia asteroides]|uniref:hypothetical protein n=1 Tax=Nocardia asteroides TaxID=1824 RepID=UPI001E2C5DFD|nr:hypothetical protein [Nocardia asteroides]UGT64544.1 hypothetical protein LTT61_15195 [Nocardia asteroides]